MRWRRSAASARALPRLTEMLTAASAKATPIVVRALGKLGDAKLVDTLLPFMARPERELRIEAMQALSKLVDERRAEQLRTELQTHATSPDQTISRVASAALAELDNRLAGGAAVAAGGTPLPAPPLSAPPPTGRSAQPTAPM